MTDSTTTYSIPPTPAELTSHIRDTLQAPVAHLRALRMQIVGWRAAAEQITEPSIVEAALAALEAGTTMPEDTHSQLEARAREHAVASTIIAACGRATVSLPTDQGMRRRTVDDVCQYLDGAMRTLSVYANEFDDDAIATSADDALNKGGKAIEAYKSTRAVVDAYGEIRRLQAQAYTDSGESLLSEKAARSAHFANALDTEDYWIERRRSLASRPSAVKDQKQYQWLLETPTTPWERISIGAWPKNVQTFADQIKFTLWALREAKPWVPTPTELAEADDQNNSALVVRNVTTNDQPAGQRGRAAAARG